MSRLVLWDVDHTLIDSAGVSKEIYAAAFANLTDRVADYPAQTEGRTDPEIMADMLRSHGAPSIPWEQVQRALEEAGAAHRQALAKRGMVLPGVDRLTTVLAGTCNVVQTIVSGNIQANARVKLTALGLARSFDLDIGAYGSDDHERSRLVGLARKRAAEKYGTEYGDESNVVVIGDTPRDVEAACRGGGRVLAVASGTHTLDELRSAGATCVMPGLADTSAVLAYLFASPRRDVEERSGT